MIRAICCDSPGSRKVSSSSRIASAIGFLRIIRLLSIVLIEITHILEIEELDELFQDVNVVWLRNEVAQKAFIKPCTILQECR